jgi:hypothetical protein
MPRDKDFKRLVRARMGKTGESYTSARARLRPDGAEPAGPPPFGGRHPDSTALARLLAALGVAGPDRGPIGEAIAFGLLGGVGVAYFVFEYQDMTSFYLGGRINPYVQKADGTQAALERLGLPVRVQRTAGPATAERQLRAALDQGRPVIATVDVAGLHYRAVPAEERGMTPHDVLVELRGAGPVVWDLAPVPVPMTWAELAEARAGVRSVKHRLVLAEPAGPVDLAGAVAAGIADTVRGMVGPPLRNFGLPGLAKWADLLTDARDPKGWPRLLADPRARFQFLTRLFDWVETAGTGGGFFRGLYAEFLEQAAARLGRADLTGPAGGYRELAGAWTALATAAAPPGGPLGRAAELLAERRRLLQELGAEAAAELAAIQRELAALETEAAARPPLADAALPGLLADLREQTLRLRRAEEAAASALAAAVPPGSPP